LNILKESFNLNTIFLIKLLGFIEGEAKQLSRLTVVTEKSFEQDVLESSIPVIVDFSTDGCGPCEYIAPLLQEIEEDLKGKLAVVNHNVALEELIAESNELIKRYDVLGFPTLILFKEGNPVENLIGVYDKEEILERISAHL